MTAKAAQHRWRGRKAPSDNNYFTKLPEGAQVCSGCDNGPGVAKKDSKAELARLKAIGEAQLKAINERKRKAALDLFKGGRE